MASDAATRAARHIEPRLQGAALGATRHLPAPVGSGWHPGVGWWGHAVPHTSHLPGPRVLPPPPASQGLRQPWLGAAVLCTSAGPGARTGPRPVAAPLTGRVQGRAHASLRARKDRGGPRPLEFFSQLLTRRGVPCPVSAAIILRNELVWD